MLQGGLRDGAGSGAGWTRLTGLPNVHLALELQQNHR